MFRTLVALSALNVCGATLAQMQTALMIPTQIEAAETIITAPGPTASGPAGNIILPPASVRVASGGSADIAVGPGKLTIGFQGGDKFTVAAEGKAAQPLKPVSGSYGLYPATMTFNDGRKYMVAFPVARLVRVAGQQGVQAMIWYRAGTAQLAMIDGESVWIYDADTDGRYEIGKDVIRVGPATRGPVFAPLGKHFETSAGVYKVDEVVWDGSKLKYSPATQPVGKFELAYASSNTQASLVLLSKDPGQMNCTVTAGKIAGAVNLLAGDYSAQFGVITLNGQGTCAAVISPKTLQPITVAAGGTVTYAIGSPFTLEFGAKRSEKGKFVIDPASFRVKGKSGEEYLQTHWTQAPEVSLVAGASNTRPAKMPFTNGVVGQYTGSLTATGAVRVSVSGTLSGLGVVKGDAVIE